MTARALVLAWHQFRLERRMFWRSPSAAFFGFALPLVFLALFGSIFSDDQETLNYLVPGIAGLSLASNTFSALAMSVPILRDQGVLKRVRGTAMPTGSYVAAVLLSSLANAMLQMVIFVLAGKLFFGLGWPPLPLELVAMVILGVVCLSSLGVAYAHVIPNADSASAYMNIVYLPVIFISGTFFDPANTPEFLRTIAEALPLSHIIDGFTGAMVTGEHLSSLEGGLAIITLWTVFGVFFAIRGFRWESRDR